MDKIFHPLFAAVLVLIMACGIYSCGTMPLRASELLAEYGYTEIDITGYHIWCGENSSIAVTFTAIDKTNTPVSGHMCSVFGDRQTTSIGID